MLCILGKFSFWPVNLIPKNQNKNEGVYTKIAKLVINKPLTTLIITGSILLAMFTGLIGAKPTFDQLASLPNNADSVKSFELLRDGFNPGELAPVEVYVDFKSPEAVFKKENLDKIDILTNILASSEGIIRISSPTRPFGIDSPLGGADKIIKYLSSNDPSSFNIKSKVNSYTSPDKSISKFELILNENPYDEKGMDLIPHIRNHIKNLGPNSGIDLSTIYVGGETAVQYDTREAINRDQLIVLPIILLAIGLILMILLRSLIAPIYLCATIIFTYFSTIGISLLVFKFIFNQPFYTSSLPFFLFVFLNALGVDYNIYLMSRIREEAKTKSISKATQIAVAKTGGVITSAGIILAGTFSALMVLPLTDLFQLGFAVAIGVIIDTFITRTLLVPAIVKLLGKYNWWPSKIIPSNK
jgi:uncharacterized membrane protein YdfJ with MMPL/SSD domain